MKTIVDHLNAQAERYDRLARLSNAPDGSFLRQMATSYSSMAQDSRDSGPKKRITPPR